MSKYLHFRLISPLYLALQILQAQEVPTEGGDTYLEKLVVRRELTQNFDRPWPERKIVGKVRFMSAGGLQHKADADAYIKKAGQLVAEVHQEN